MGDEERRDKGILMLGDDNFDAWERAVGDALYGAGAYELVEASKHRPAVYNEAMKVYARTYQAWEELDEGDQGDEPEEPEKLYRAVGVPATKRQKAWGAITRSIRPALRAKVDKVKRGEVEDLIRAVGDQYFKATVGSRSN